MVDGAGGPDQPKAPGMFPCREPTPGPCPAAGRTSRKPRNRENPEDRETTGQTDSQNPGREEVGIQQAA